MPDFGIGEIFAALAPALFGGGEAAAVAAPEAALAGGEAGLMSAADLASTAAAAGMDVAPAGLGPAATSFSVNALPQAAGGGIGDFLGSIGSGIGNAIAPAAGAAELAGTGAPMAGGSGGAAALTPPSSGASAVDAATGPIGDFWNSVNPQSGGGLSGLTAQNPGPLQVPPVQAQASAIGPTGQPTLAPYTPALNDLTGQGIAPTVPAAQAAPPGPAGSPESIAAQAAQPQGVPQAAPAAPAAGGAGGEIGPSASAAGPSSNASALSASLDQQALNATTIPPTDITPTGTPGGAAPAAATPAAPGTAGGFTDWLKKNPALLASLGLGGAALAMGANQKVPQQQNLQALVDSEKQFQQQQQELQRKLTDPLLTGVLPPDQQASVDRALNDAIATTKARYAQMGLANSSALSDQIAYLQQQSQTIKAQLETQMAQTGTAAAGTAATAFGLQNSVFQSLMNAQIQQDTALRNAIAQFAGSAAVGSGLSARA